VGNVPYDATEERLADIFSEVGPVHQLVTDRDTGKLKGYGFAEFMDLATAQSAKRNLNGRDYNGRALRVEFQDGEDGAPPAKKPDRGAPPATAIAASGVAAGSGLDAITARIAEMSPAQLFNVFNQLKAQIQSNQSQTRQMLVQNPQLTFALFQAQLTLGMAKPPV
ncbi:uncharacterized protein MICPUCDRAFT_7053, partial [Micromonas pusilla CCMP1545]